MMSNPNIGGKLTELLGDCTLLNPDSEHVVITEDHRCLRLGDTRPSQVCLA
jgi:hypothetical protein